MDFKDDVSRKRLADALDQNYRKLAPFRECTRGLVIEYAGSGYGANTSNQKDILLNLMNQAVDAATMALVANVPQVLVTPKNPELAYFAKKYQSGINSFIKEIRLVETLRKAVMDAFFCVGVVKMHMIDSVEVEVEEGIYMDPGLPFASNVSIDNFVFDMGASEWHKIKFAADCYRIPHEDLKDDIFDQTAIGDIKPAGKAMSEEDRIEYISQGYVTDSDELVDMVDLMDVWIPREGKIYTFVMDPVRTFVPISPPIAVMDWEGPEIGPYKLLGFNDVPQNIMPTAPALHLSGLSRLINNMLRKQRRQAMRAKSVLLYSPAAVDDASKITNASDGSSVPVQHPGEVEVKTFDGVDEKSHAFTLGLKDEFDRAAGNLQAKMGLGPTAETLGQEKMIHGVVSNKEAQMQLRVMQFTKEVIHDLGWMLWHDIAQTIPNQVPIEGVDGYYMDTTWSPEDREGEFYDYDFDIDVHSMPYQSPSQRLQAITAFVTQIISPMEGMLTAQGGQINMTKLVDIFSDLLNEPRLKELVEFQVLGDPAMMAQPEQGGGKSPVTSREYIRRSVPSGGTPENRSAVKQSEWLGMHSQNNQDQKAAATA